MKAGRPNHQVGKGQAGEGSQQFAGEHLHAADRFGQQEVGGQFGLFDRDQPKAVVAGLDGQAELDEQKDETIKTKNAGEVHHVQTKGGAAVLAGILPAFRSSAQPGRQMPGKERRRTGSVPPGPATR